MRKRKFISVFLAALMLAVVFSVTASADMGPKPSVHVNFNGIGDDVCYATLLSKTESTGPASAWDGNDENAYHQGISEYYGLPYEIWLAFVEYEDADGYYFLQEGWLVDDSTPLAWTYYPPSSFKVLLYFPEREIFISSGIYERYAFDSYFTMTVGEAELTGGRVAEVERSYDYTLETVSLFARIIGTVAVELLVALIFFYFKRGQLALFAVTNGVTQILLNIVLNIVNYKNGSLAFILTYVELEILVIAVEAVLYALLISVVSGEKKSRLKAVIYALVANMASFAAGLGIATVIPAMF